MRDEFEPGMRVRHKYTGRTGTVVSDFYGACTKKEVPVSYDDAPKPFVGTDWQQLERLNEGGGGWSDPSLIVAVS